MEQDASQRVASTAPRFDWPGEPAASSRAADGARLAAGPAQAGWAAYDARRRGSHGGRRALLALAVLAALVWAIGRCSVPPPRLALSVTSEGALASPDNVVHAGQSLGPQALVLANSGTLAACWWLSASADNPAFAPYLRLTLSDAAGHVLYAGPLPTAANPLAGSACAHPPIGVASGSEAVLAPGGQVTLTVRGSVGALPATLNGQQFILTWTPLGAPADP